MVIINELKKRNVQNVQILVDKGDKGASTIKSICKLNYTPNALSWIFFWGGDRKGRGVRLGGWMRGWLGIGEGVLTRASMRAPVLGVLFFLLSQVSQRMELKKLHHPKKTTCRFVERDVSFCGK